MSETRCDVCDDEIAVFRCEQCDMFLCADDDASVHKPAKLAGHVRTAVGGAPAASPAATAAAPAPAEAALCDLCEDAPAVANCADCKQVLCKACCDDLHKPARMQAHKRTDLATGAPLTTTATTTPAATRPTSAVAVNPATATPALPAGAVAAAAAASASSSASKSSARHSSRRSTGGTSSSARGGPAQPSAAKSSPTPSPRSLPPLSATATATPAPAQTQTQAAQPTTPLLKPRVEEEKESSSSSFATQSPPPATAAASATPAASASPSSPSPRFSPPAADSASAASSSSFVTPPKQPVQRAMSASQSASTIGGRSRTAGRPRSAMPASSSKPKGGDGTASGFMLTAPRTLRLALSPTRSVLSMSYGSRWEEPDTRAYKASVPGTFGTMNRDGSPKKTRNLLYSKSASDLIGAPGSQHSGEASAAGSRPGSAAAILRLSKPKVFVSSVISPLFSDIKECRFRPEINELSQSMVGADGEKAFQDRLALSVELYKTKKLKPEGMSLPPGATFKPTLFTSTGSPAAAAVGPDGSAAPAVGSKLEGTRFVDRMQSDLVDRKRHAEENAAKPVATFTPEIAPSSRKRTAKITTPFLDRLREDLSGRDDGIASRRADAEKLPYSFQPNPERMQRANYSFHGFLGRMENDLGERKNKYEERCKMFNLPTPDEVAAAVRGGGGSKK